MKFIIQTPIDMDYKKVFQAFDLNLFKALKPPLVPLEVSQFDGCKTGDKVILKVGPFKQTWQSDIVEDFESETEIGFIDMGTILPAPLKSWRHCHRILNKGENQCLISDEIEYSSGNLLMDILLYIPMYFQFLIRYPQYKIYFNKL